MDKIDIVNLGKNKAARLKLYERNQHKGLVVKKADGSRDFLKPYDLANAIMTLKNELKLLREKYKLTVG